MQSIQVNLEYNIEHTKFSQTCDLFCYEKALMSRNLQLSSYLTTGSRVNISRKGFHSRQFKGLERDTPLVSFFQVFLTVTIKTVLTDEIVMFSWV